MITYNILTIICILSPFNAIAKCDKGGAKNGCEQLHFVVDFHCILYTFSV